MPKLISNFTRKMQQINASIKRSTANAASSLWSGIKKVSFVVASFFNELYQQLKGWSIAIGRLIYIYRLELLRTISVIAFVYLLALNPFIALTVGVIGLFYFMNRRISADLKKLERNERHNRIKKEITNACTPLEKFAHACYDLFSKTVVAKPFADSLVSDFHAISALNESNGIHILQARTDSDPYAVVLACRGTKFGEFDDSVVIDFDPDSPGKSAFDRLVKSSSPLDKIVLGDNDNKISICGHSLGGAISMRLAVEIMKAIEKEARADTNARFANIKELNIAIFNSAGVDEALVKEANDLVDKLGGRLQINFYAHFADLDPVTGSGLQLFADKQADNLSVYMVRKHLSLRMFAKVFPFNPALMHSMPFYGNHNYKLDDETNSLNKKIIEGRQHFYCNKPLDETESKEDAQEIKRIFSATYSKFICNRVLYNLLKWIGPDNLTAIRELGVLVAAVSVFIYYTVAVITAPTLFAYFAAWSALLYIFTAVEVSKTLDDTWGMVVRFFSWPARKIQSIRKPTKSENLVQNVDPASTPIDESSVGVTLSLAS